MAAKTLAVNGTDYRWPDHPVVVVCIDGGDPQYIAHGVSAGIIPNITRYMNEGFHTVARGTMPSFTHRLPGVGARHLRKLLSRSRDQRAGGDDRA